MASDLQHLASSLTEPDVSAAMGMPFGRHDVETSARSLRDQCFASFVGVRRATGEPCAWVGAMGRDELLRSCTVTGVVYPPYRNLGWPVEAFHLLLCFLRDQENMSVARLIYYPQLGHPNVSRAPAATWGGALREHTLHYGSYLDEHHVTFDLSRTQFGPSCRF